MFDERIEKLNEATAREAQMGQFTEFSFDKRTYSVEEIMNFLEISKPTAYKLIHSNLFHFVKVGQQIRISKKSFDAWLEGTA